MNGRFINNLPPTTYKTKNNIDLNRWNSYKNNSNKLSGNSISNTERDNYIIMLESENKKLKAQLKEKDNMINSLQNQIRFMELTNKNNDKKGYSSQTREMKQERKRYQSTDKIRNVNYIDEDYKLAQRLYQEELKRVERMNKRLRHQDRPRLELVNDIPEELIDPVKEVEEQIINELCPNPDAMTYEQLLSLENKVGSVKRGLSKQELSKIPFKIYAKYKYNGQDECSICRDNYQTGEQIKELPCGHIYHVNCIDKWLEQERKCPYCNKEIRFN